MKGSFFSCSRQNMTQGSVKTSVLPEPVKAMPIISRPDNLYRKYSMSLTHSFIIIIVVVVVIIIIIVLWAG
jgi:hypothetical protein